MASYVARAETPKANSKRSKITVTQKRWLLSAHLLFVTAWLGTSFCVLAFNITALFTSDPHLLNTISVFTGSLDQTVSRIGAGGTGLTGILLAVLTQWGLLRFYWLNLKEIVSILCVTIDLIVIRWNEQLISLSSSLGPHVLSNPAYLTNRTLLLIGVLFKIVALAGVIAVSIFKPWGQRKAASQRKVLPAS
ncbi:MAG TPA: hypothetical protein VGD98_10250 [Ktedonobacteraceae bacterium]